MIMPEVFNLLDGEVIQNRKFQIRHSIHLIATKKNIN